MLRILTYHRIAEYDMYSPMTNVSTTPDAFAEQMRFLHGHYSVVGVEEVLQAIHGGTQLRDDAVLITFDDAYRDFKDVALPILKKYGFPATLFVPTAYPGNPHLTFWWDRIKAALMTTAQLQVDAFGTLYPLHTSEERYRCYLQVLAKIERTPHEEAMEIVDALCNSLREYTAAKNEVLSWDELRNLAAEGISIAPHTRTHPIMTKISPERVREEVRGSRKDVEQHIGNAPPVFAFPSGKTDGTVVDILRQEGFQMAFTTLDGHNDMPPAEPLRLCRTNIFPATTMPIFRLRLLPGVAYLNRLRHRARQRLAAA